MTMRRIWPSLGILALLAVGLVVAVQASAPSGSIDDFIASEMPNSGAPGLAFAVVKDGVIQSDELGEVLIGSGRKVIAETPFVLGSITKSFTAMAVMQLVEASQVDLDAGISHYLPEFLAHASGAITIRQLLSHTSGYSTLQGNETHTDLTGSEDELSRQVERIAHWKPAYRPGARWEYSNANYQILGALVEAVSGRDYATYVETEILEPIGMERSFVADGKSHDMTALGHRPWFGTKRALEVSTTERVIAPAGGVYASASDMAKYLVVMMNGDDDVISAASKAEMLRPASKDTPSYGLGWFIDAHQGSVYHTGTSPGVETLAVMVPAEKKGVVVLVNAGSGIGFGETSELLNGISARALGLDYADDGSRWEQKALFVGMALLPLVFVISMIWAWFHRAALVTKSGPFGLFSLWFPLLATLAMTWFLFCMIPQLFGLSMGTLDLYQPDLVLIFKASALTGVTWAIFRLGIAYGCPKRA